MGKQLPQFSAEQSYLYPQTTKQKQLSVEGKKKKFKKCMKHLNTLHSEKKKNQSVKLKIAMVAVCMCC